MKVGSGAEHRTKLKANKIVAIIFENLLHSIALQQHPEPDQPEPRSTQTRFLFFPASKKRNYCQLNVINVSIISKKKLVKSFYIFIFIA